ncbi:MAG: Crp/Fnr family transcriptional regulator [Rubricoccaceae bacterium]
MESFREYLRQFPGYTDLAFERVAPQIVEERIGKGEALLRLGATSDRISFIQQGLFRQVYLIDGKEVTTCFCREHTLTCSYRSLITQQPSELAIEALEESQVLSLMHRDLQALYDQDPFWQQVGRMAAEQEVMVRERHLHFVQDLSAADRYEHILREERDLLQRVSLQHLASYMQVAPETLSRVRKQAVRS